jgi:deazaflavin-dependent oxidoreductase (nitroreductase family)
MRDGDRIVVCNVNPGFDHNNPWVLNLRASPVAAVQIGADSHTDHARVANGDDIDCYWPRLLKIWPAYQVHFSKSGQRTIFILEKVEWQLLDSR